MYDENLFAIDTTGVEKMGGYEIYPSGMYPAVMISAAKKPTKNNDGYFIECVYTFIEGDMQGKKYTSRMNLWNNNPQTVDIAKRELKSIRAALGLGDHASNPAEFVNKPMVLNIGVKPRKDDATKMENYLISIQPYGNAAPVATSAPAYQPQPMAAPQPTWQPPQQQQWSPPPQQAPAQMPPQAFQPAPGSPPPWARQ